MDQAISWFTMPIGVQISNVGSEVHRAIRWKNRGELDCCIDELKDYFMGENVYNTTEEQLIKYYDAFL